jgi:hypothetical protein
MGNNYLQYCASVVPNSASNELFDQAEPKQSVVGCSIGVDELLDAAEQ